MLSFFGVNVNFKGNLAAGTGLGLSDEFKCFSNSDIKEAELQRNMLNNCLPPSRWFSENAYTKAMHYMKVGDYQNAIKTLDIDAIGNVDISCVWIFQKVIIQVVKQCPKLLSDALPTTFY